MQKKTDFVKILSTLKENGINDYKLAELTGIERTKLSRLRTGKIKQPAYDDGVKIVDIFNKETKS